MTNLWFCVVSACFWVLLAGFTGKFKRDYLHPVVMFSILFSISYPLKLIMSFYGFHTLDSMSVDDEVILLSIFVFNLAGIAFVVPLLVGKPIITDSNIFRIKAFPIYMTALLIVLFLIISYGSEALGAIFSTDGLRARIDERGGERVGSGLSALFRQAGSFLIIIFAMQFIHTKNKKIVLFFVFILFYSWLALSLSGSKYEAFYMVVVSFITYYYYKRAKGIEILNFTRMILGFTGALIFVGLIGYARGYGAWEGESKHPFLLQTLYQLINAFDAPDNLIVLLDRGESWLTGSIGMTLARDYLILPFIPRAIWSGKPLVQGNQLVMESYFPERFSVIHSMRYSRTRKMWNSVSLLLFQQASQECWFFYI